MACDEWSRRIHENKAWRSFGLAELMLNYSSKKKLNRSWKIVGKSVHEHESLRCI